jgi:DNA polymerase III epsilon subunit-like protein
MNNIIVFDTETTGFSPEKNEIVQLSYILYDMDNQTVLYATSEGEDIVNITGEIPEYTSNVHGITKEMTLHKRPIKDHIAEFITHCNKANKFVGHNISFDIRMIVGQIKKIINKLQDEDPTEISKYNEFLSKFDMVEKVVEGKPKTKAKTTRVLPDIAYCTMNGSKSICAELKGVNKVKNEKLIEVHKLLFNEDVGGQLHNALIDISVTLRIYIKLTMNIDICVSMSELDMNGPTTLTNNNEICNFIKPIPITEEIENIDYSGELITGIETTSSGGLVEKTINVQTIAKQMATDLVSSTLSTYITVSTEPLIKKISRGFVSDVFSSLTKKNNKVAPIGGRRKKRSVKKRKSIKRK